MVGVDEINDVFDTPASSSGSDFRHVIDTEDMDMEDMEDMETLRSHDALGREKLATIPNPDRGAVVG